MTFKECVPWIKLYQKVCREIWYPGVYILTDSKGYLYTFYPDGGIKPYCLTKEDGQASDWYVPILDEPGAVCGICGQVIRKEDAVEPTIIDGSINVRHVNWEEQCQ